MSEPISQEINLSADPQRVYETLTSAAAFSAFSGAPAELSAEAGGAIALFGGQVTGCNIELIPGQRIVQAWRVGTWEDGVYSIVRFDLAPSNDGTRLTLNHSAYPEGNVEHLGAGWHKMYWEPLQAYLTG